MSGKTAGFIVARALALVLLLQSFDLALAQVSKLQQDGQANARALLLIEPLVQFVTAIILWLAAGRFGGRAERSGEPPMADRAVLGVAILGVSAGAIATHLGPCLDDFLFWRDAPVAHSYWPDCVTLLIALACLICGWKMSSGPHAFTLQLLTARALAVYLLSQSTGILLTYGAYRIQRVGSGLGFSWTDIGAVLSAIIVLAVGGSVWFAAAWRLRAQPA